MESLKGYTQDIAEKIRHEVNKAVVNQDEILYFSLTALLAEGHVLIEGVPGLGKTLLSRSIAKTLQADFKRVQFTSDLMPSDIMGTKIYNMKENEFTLRKGPLFTHIFLADEINRTPPKTQSALLEVMEERSISIDGTTHQLPNPFFVMATQNPLEFEGTYPLPEALVDRFMMKLIIDYPGIEAEKQILSMYHTGFEAKNLDIANIEPVCRPEDLQNCKQEIKDVRVDSDILNYIMEIIDTTRKINVVQTGTSPRGSIALLLACKTYAAIMGRDFVIPDDVQEMALPILRHRIILNPQAEIDGITTDSVITKVLSTITVPR